jgi:hypothetical protein
LTNRVRGSKAASPANHLSPALTAVWPPLNTIPALSAWISADLNPRRQTHSSRDTDLFVSARSTPVRAPAPSRSQESLQTSAYRPAQMHQGLSGIPLDAETYYKLRLCLKRQIFPHIDLLFAQYTQGSLKLREITKKVRIPAESLNPPSVPPPSL